MHFNQQTGEEIKLLSEDQRGIVTYEDEDGDIHSLPSQQFHALHADSQPPEKVEVQRRLPRHERRDDHKSVAAQAKT